MLALFCEPRVTNDYVSIETKIICPMLAPVLRPILDVEEQDTALQLKNLKTRLSKSGRIWLSAKEDKVELIKEILCPAKTQISTAEAENIYQLKTDSPEWVIVRYLECNKISPVTFRYGDQFAIVYDDAIEEVADLEEYDRLTVTSHYNLPTPVWRDKRYVFDDEAFMYVTELDVF